MKDLKYLFAYSAPITALVAFHFGGIWSFATFYLAFLIIPSLELFLPGSKENLSEHEENSQLKKNVFNWLLYANLPMILGFLFYFFYVVSTQPLMAYEIAGMTISAGIMLGYGINVAHELGHRNTAAEQLMSKLMLLPSHYMHFIIEHNLGHHKNVSTDKDPASSRMNETIYAFFIRSTVMSYLHAWQLESQRLKREAKAFWSVYNQMIWFQVIQATYLFLIFWFFGTLTLLVAIVAGIIGFIMLESVNYIEHYGLRRKKLASGHYEPVQPYHSWNSNHELGRIFLYELTRHSDHHFKSTRKYQVLRHFDESPQLPYGYPGSMLMAWIPPLWFSVMNPKVKKYAGENVEKIDLALA